MPVESAARFARSGIGKLMADFDLIILFPKHIYGVTASALHQKGQGKCESGETNTLQNNVPQCTYKLTMGLRLRTLY